MIRHYGIKQRLEPTPSQEARLRVLVGHARFVWNKALGECDDRLARGEYVPNYEAMCKWLTQWKTDPDTHFLKDAYTDNLQQKMKDLRVAWDRYFNPELDAERPTYKKKDKCRDSIRIMQFDRYCQHEHRWVRLPAKLGWVRFRETRPFIGTIKSCTISFDNGAWYISFAMEAEITPAPVHPSPKAVGVDMGVAAFAATSDGALYRSLNAFRKIEAAIAKETRKLKHKQKFSRNWKKQKRVIARLYRKAANARHDYLHKLTSAISKSHAMVVLEDLKVKNMSASAQGTVDNPGKHVKAKSGLNKAILDQGWYAFRRMMAYKLEWQGGMLVLVPPQYTSQTCPECGHVHQDNRLTRDQFVCQVCAHADHADIVAARNILARGHQQLSGQDVARRACEVNGAARPSAAGTVKPGDGLISPQSALAL